MCRYLSTGDSYLTIALNFRTGISTVQAIIQRVCHAIWDILQPLYMPEPDTEAWYAIAKGFEEKWQFPHCCGAIDGKHIVIQAPANSGTLYHNYKGTFSIVLLAVVDHNYCFTMVDIGSYGHHSDSGIFVNCAFGKRLYHGSMNIPPPKELTAMPELGPMPFCIVGDEAFPLTTFMMRPYPGRGLTDEQRVFNYRLSRARRISENAFGILSARWRIFRRVCNLKPTHVDSVVRACVVIHNYLTRNNQDIATERPADVEDLTGDTFSILQPMSLVRHSKSSKEAVEYRKLFTKYFNSKGTVSWQRELVEKGD